LCYIGDTTIDPGSFLAVGEIVIHQRIIFGLLTTAAVSLGAMRLIAIEPVKLDGEQLFATKIRPLFVEKCLACHGAKPDDIKSSFDLRTRESALRGGESGDLAIVLGKPEKSLLYQAVRWDGLEMPPKKNDRLTGEQIELIRQWIVAGAPWADTRRAAADSPRASSLSTKNASWSDTDGVPVKTSGGLTAEWTNRRYKSESIWEYQPITRPNVPKPTIDAARMKNPIDAFVQARLAKAGVTRLADAADDRTFIRRATFDLLGLPPTAAEVQTFLADKSPNARERLIDRLLASPHYGEQQARHWLDAVRYADTSGFSNDVERPNAWRYRDYVIRSFNGDKRYDRFITEQLAGDELDPKNPEMLIAVGFLRMGPWEHTTMTVAAVTRQQFLDDVTQNVGVALLGQGLRCASCHDHKFDPIPTRDYYRLQAIFAPVQFVERPAAFLASENVSGFANARKRVKSRLANLDTLQRGLRQKSLDARAAYLRERGARKLEDLPIEKRPTGGNFGNEFGLSKTEQSLQKIYEKNRLYLERELERFEPNALSLYDGTDNGYLSVKPVYAVSTKRGGVVPAVRILAGGSLESPLDAVKPGLLSAMTGANDLEKLKATNTVPDTTEGRRVALAKWIASRDNTLTARVMVNRIWQQHFGKGIVATANNFGSMGARPVHPELLDWLATWFVEHDWSIKQLHRLIMTSATYQEASDHPDRDQIDTIDPTDSLLAHFPPRRLAAEEIRDSLLAITGELNPEMGGPGVFPEINWEVATQPRHIMGSVAPAYLPSKTPQERNRRTIYAFRYRTLPDPFLEVFNRPGCDTSCESRDQTTVTPQAFALLNSEFVQHRALAHAATLYKDFPTLEERLRATIMHMYGRLATASEIDICKKHFEESISRHRKEVLKPVPLPTHVKRGMIEEFTGEMVYWDEELSLEDYQRDTMPWDVGPDVRALADVCLVLLNSNEFLYVR
jgi:mono/diheme cytochrome c family protein